MILIPYNANSYSKVVKHKKLINIALGSGVRYFKSHKYRISPNIRRTLNLARNI